MKLLRAKAAAEEKICVIEDGEWTLDGKDLTISYVIALWTKKSSIRAKCE
jgi:HJR/Mrr/RecB family endonuclease